MPKLLKKCNNCRTYTMQDPPCKHCNSEDVRSVYPPRFSVDDKYAKYRREMKKRIKQESS